MRRPERAAGFLLRSPGKARGAGRLLAKGGRAADGVPGGKDSQRPLRLPPKEHSCVQSHYDLARARMNSQAVWESGTLRQAEPERASGSMRGVLSAAGKAAPGASQLLPGRRASIRLQGSHQRSRFVMADCRQSGPSAAFAPAERGSAVPPATESRWEGGRHHGDVLLLAAGIWR